MTIHDLRAYTYFFIKSNEKRKKKGLALIENCNQGNHFMLLE